MQVKACSSSGLSAYQHKLCAAACHLRLQGLIDCLIYCNSHCAGSAGHIQGMCVCNIACNSSTLQQARVLWMLTLLCAMYTLVCLDHAMNNISQPCGNEQGQGRECRRWPER
jgi:hypothetical protein